jgi:deazaflavin-dependent oxidoreductase (nitroreductase family)
MPPRRFIRLDWAIHRAAYAVLGSRRVLKQAARQRSGMLRLRTIGRRTGEERRALLGYQEDGPNIVLVAMNGWADSEPAWWLNLQAHPDARVDLADGTREVTARLASGDEWSRLWAGLAGPFGDLDRYAALRRETALVILELATGRVSGRRTPVS